MKPIAPLLLSALLPALAHAELKLPAIIGDNMVLQQKQTNPIWGWDTPGTEVTVKFGGQSKSAKADDKGKWTVKLDPVPANAEPAVLSVSGTSKRDVQNVLVGEVWLCSGQSNMGFTTQQARDADVELLTCNIPQIRLVRVPNVGIQEPQDDFKGEWKECTPQSAAGFTAVGFFYGKLLHEMLHVPVGLIDNAWGGSSCEAWVRRDLLEKDARFKGMMDKWKQTESQYTADTFDKEMEAYRTKLAAWNKARQEAAKKKEFFDTPAPRPPQNPMKGQHRPGNLYSGCLHPIIGYGIKGAIWYQGESNAGGAFEYSYLFPLMIQSWRDEWKSGDFPFYWVQLADYKNEQPQPGDSDWAELRESQTKTQSAIKNGGQAVIIDLGEAKDIHPKNKRDVAERLVRWPLVKEYGIKLPYRSPEFKTAVFDGGKATVTLDTFGSSIQTFDVAEARGFAVCGEDKQWAWADAKVTGPATVEVTCKTVAKPVAVRYAWADNPVCNLYSKEWLPVTPFRSDSFPMITDPKTPKAAAQAPKKAAKPAAPAKPAAAVK